MTHKLFNDYIEIQIKSKGAELCSLKKENLEYLWQGDEKFWARHAPVLFPIVGKLIDDEYILNDKTYKMYQHGFARDCDFELIKKTENSLSFKLTQSNQTLEKYPFNFELYISYALLQNKVKISYEVKNNSDETMPFSIGAHPAFNWPLEDEIKKENYYFGFENTNKLELLPLTSQGIDSKTKTIFLDENKLPINEELFKNDALIVKDLKNKTITLKSFYSDRFIKMSFPNFEYLGLWSKPSGAPFVCIEPWHGIADFIEHDKKIENKKGIKILKKDEIFRSKYYIEI